MHHLKIVGLCLVSMFALSAANSAAASAAWEQCAEGTEKVSPTKYTEHQCLKAASANNGKWQWSEVKTTEKIIGRNTLTLEDIKVPVVGKVAVKCTFNEEGTIGPGQFYRVEEFREISCSAGENCEKLEEVVLPQNLPWQTEIFETEKTKRTKVTNGKTGSEAPGARWACRVLDVEDEDRCTNNEGSALLENKTTKGSGGTELLVLEIYETKSPKGECTVGGAGSWVVEGVIAILKANGWGLRIS